MIQSTGQWMRRITIPAMIVAAALCTPSFAAPAATAAGPVYIHPPVVEGEKAVKVTMPPLAKPGVHPCLVLTPPELVELKEGVKNTDRGRQAYKSLIDMAEGTLKTPLVFPDPKGPMGQMKDRGDAVAKAHDALSTGAGRLGMAYLISGNKKYADRAADILRGYAERYAEYPEHRGVNHDDTGKVMGQRLSEAMWLLPLLESYDDIYDSGSLTAADKKNIEQKLFVTCVEFIRRDGTAAKEAAARDQRNPNWRTTTPPKPRRNSPVGNWLNFYAAATMLTGAVTHNQDMMDLAAADYRQYIQDGISDDGMWNEGAIGYQLFALNAMVTGLEAAARQGVDLYSFDNCRIKMLFDSPLWYAYPDSSMPGINDSSRVRMGGWTTEVYDYGYKRFHDPNYAAVINRSMRQLAPSEGIYVPAWIFAKLPETATTTYPSIFFRDLGYGILRDKTRYVLLKGGHPSGVHEHLDKLNMIVFDKDELGGVPRMHKYENPLHDQWTKTSLANNTMTVDEHSQAIGNATYMVFEDGGALKAMRAESANVYPGVVLDRTVVLTPTLIIDVYHGQSADEHTWDSTLRFQGTLEGMPAAATPAKMLGSKDGYQHFEVRGRVPAAAHWDGVWDTTVGKLDVSAAGAPGQEAILGTGPDRDNIALLRQKGTEATFAKALKLDGIGPEITSTKLLQPGNGQPAVFEIRQGDLATDIYVSYAPGKWKAGNMESDARVLVVMTQGKTSQVLLTGGTFAKVAGADLSFDNAGNYVATVEDGKANVTSKWSPK